MARICEICKKGNISGHKISHALNHSKRVWKPNLRRVRIVDDNKRVRRVYVCAKCLRSNRVTRAV